MNENGILANIPGAYTIPEMAPDNVREMLQQLSTMRSNVVGAGIFTAPRRTAVRFEYNNQRLYDYLRWDYQVTPKEAFPVDPNKCNCDNGVIKGKYEDEECERCGGTGILKQS